MRDVFSRFKSEPKAEDLRKLRGEPPFVHECFKALCNLSGSSDLSRSRKKLYRDFMVGSTSDPLIEWLGWSIKGVRLHWNWVPGSGFLNNSEFSLTWLLAWNALPFLGLNYEVGLVYMPN